MKHLKRSFKLLFLCGLVFSCTKKLEIERPNVLLIVTDDQGHGDIGFHGNTIIQTPNLDNLAAKSIRFSNFYASPVCSPTRASLMTGRYSLRTGIYDTYMGGSTMATEEVTLAEVLQENGYRTGLFGKWHLGDNSPYLPQDQGFEEVLMHYAGGLEQPGDFIENRIRKDSSYFNPYLLENENKVQKKGYITDILTDAAIDYISKNDGEPFFCYLAYNAPHGPLEVPQKYIDLYNFESYPFENLPNKGNDEREKMKKAEVEKARKVYAMMTNVDDNIGRLLQTLEKSGMAENTIIIFMSDNGPEGRRYNSGLYGRKGSIYEGGTRVPSYWYFPNQDFGKSRNIKKTAAHIDVMPSLLSLLNIHKQEIDFDGTTLFDDLESDDHRTLFFQWNRGYPPKFQNFAVHQGDYKLTGPYSSEAPLDDLKLFNKKEDPYEQHNLAPKENQKVKDLLSKYEVWYQDVTSSPNYKSIKPIHVGDKEVRLNRNDWWGTHAKNWGSMEGNGRWNLKVLEERIYDIEVNFQENVPGHGQFRLRIGQQDYTIKNKDTSLTQIVFKDVHLLKGVQELHSWYYEYWPKKGIYGPYDVYIKPKK